MTISPSSLLPPQPSTERAQTSHISYDQVHDRIAYANGKSIIVRPVDPNSDTPVIQFTKHIYQTTVASFSPTGNYVASGDESGQVKIWDTSLINSPGAQQTPFEQPTVKSEFQILSGPIKSIAWDGDSARVIAVGQGKDKFGHCFSWDSGNSVGEIQGHSTSINAVDIKRQRPYRAATVSDDKALVFYNGPPFKFDKSLRSSHSNSIRDVKFSPDGKWLVSVGADRIIVLYDGKSGEFVNKIENAHEGGIFSVSWCLDSSHFVTSSADNTLKKWSPETGTAVSSFTVDSGSVENQQVGVVVAKNFIVSLSLNGNFNYFKDDVSSPIKILKGHQTSVTSSYFLEGNFYAGGADGRIFEWNLEKNSLLNFPKSLGKSGSEHRNYVSDIKSLEGGILSIGWDDELKLWREGTPISNELDSQPKGLAVSGSAVIVLFESKLQVWSNGRKVAEAPFKYASSSISSIPFTNKILITNETDSKLEEFEFSENSIKPVESKYPKLRAPPTLVRVSPNGEFVAVADSTGKYTLYKIQDASVVTTRWAFHSSKVIDAEWTRDSSFLLSGGLDSSILLYSVSRPSKVLKFPLAHQNGVTGLQWTSYIPDSKSGTFISTGSDACVKTWEVDISAY